MREIGVLRQKKRSQNCVPSHVPQVIFLLQSLRLEIIHLNFVFTCYVLYLFVEFLKRETVTDI